MYSSTCILTAVFSSFLALVSATDIAPGFIVELKEVDHARQLAYDDAAVLNTALGSEVVSSASSTDIGLATLFDAIIGPSAQTTLIRVVDQDRKVGKRQDGGATQVVAPTSTITVTTATTQVATFTSSVPSTTTIVNTQDVTLTTSFFTTTTQVSTVQGRTITSTTVNQVTSTFVTTGTSTLQTTAVQTTTAISTQPSSVTSTVQETATQIGTTFVTVTATVTGPTSTATGQAVTTTLPPATVQVQRTSQGPVVYPTTGPCAPVFRNGPMMYCQGNA
ncbi:hypothetical protein Slin14017_G068750 [Septoria linicola]|nr:hypothetical protein Slin14017_G068750 [Septoria linicola]